MYIRSDMPQKRMQDGRLILYDKITKQTHVLNSCAARIYELCCYKCNEEIAEELINGIENVEISEVLEDVKASIADFINNGIILEVK